MIPQRREPSAWLEYSRCFPQRGRAIDDIERRAERHHLEGRRGLPRLFSDSFVPSDAGESGRPCNSERPHRVVRFDGDYVEAFGRELQRKVRHAGPDVAYF